MGIDGKRIGVGKGMEINDEGVVFDGKEIGAGKGAVTNNEGVGIDEEEAGTNGGGVRADKKEFKICIVIIIK